MFACAILLSYSAAMRLKYAASAAASGKNASYTTQIAHNAMHSPTAVINISIHTYEQACTCIFIYGMWIMGVPWKKCQGMQTPQNQIVNLNYLRRSIRCATNEWICVSVCVCGGVYLSQTLCAAALSAGITVQCVRPIYLWLHLTIAYSWRMWVWLANMKKIVRIIENR